ncbi:MAG: FIG00453548: hypothetical protein [uncultured Paraburkholderia sp.]|uniref:DUF3348 domain-containing protein n=1 Tax=uncultured Paraburkholderia sp. TaxID=1822466 RepID=UPI0025933D52|nr:DUF3348 domain-containing protein [uncultured Paraburkholderia sp.]CAH2895774.1 MAG: FIG00453548: hypothetical protein [uncultured Paraburkholderia sp.]CAH2938477.1 MAG: FIG00453548: hypothetical protein [uncultured Paraburkholderia sp.]
MLQALQRTAPSGPALIRLLARFADADVPEPRQSLSDRLSQWLGWTDAIALSSALTGAPPSVPATARAFGSAEEAECARVRASLVKTITGDSAFAVARRRGAGYVEPQAVPVDYALFRQRYQAMQQSMETGVGNLRGRLRALLAAKTPAMGRLALLDAVMERALGERERNLLASVPVLLAGHFERLREAAQQAQDQEPAPALDDGTQAESAASRAASTAAGNAAAAGSSAAEGSVEAKAHVQAQPQPQAPALDAATTPAEAVAPNAWLDVFRKDMQSVLLAELDVRLQPVEGLLAALRTR